ncbi:MAG: transglutaminase-like cysteine peptidase [Arcobacteraceae bacterium]|nr:transglutaminase-like cysteine peptidase [Arcobacteraceae bacterium]
MFKIIVFIVMAFIYINANETKRIENLKQFIGSLSTKNTEQKINSVNLYFNQIVPAYDSFSDVNRDEWDTMIDFVKKGKGDCEEYAISKYQTLKMSGVDENKLYLMVVRERTRQNNEFHLVTAYYETKTNPLILDNLSFKVLPLSKRIDLHPIMIFNEENSYNVDKLGRKMQSINSEFPLKLRQLKQKLTNQTELYKPF